MLGCPGSLLARWFIPRLDRLNRDLPELRLQLSASEGELDPRKPGLDATLWYAEPPWPADMRRCSSWPPSASARCSAPTIHAVPTFAAPPSAVLDETLLHTASRPQAWPNWARQQGLDPARLRLGQSFEHLYFLLEAALAGLGVAIAQQLVADDLRQGRRWRPGASSRPAPDWRSGCPRGESTGAPSVWRSGCATSWSGNELRITDTANATTVALLSTCSFRRRRAGHAGVELGIGHRVLAARQRSGSDAFCFAQKELCE